VSNQDKADAYRARMAEPPKPLVIVVPVTVTVNLADYALNYGHSDDVAEYTAETVRAAAAEQFDRLGWGTVTTEDPTTDPRSQA
jgi:phosphopentomutase